MSASKRLLRATSHGEGGRNEAECHPFTVMDTSPATPPKVIMSDSDATLRLYRTDSYRTEFSAPVAQTRIVKGRPEVRLEQTAFYPTAGGQAFDTGWLGGTAIIEVRENDGGQIWHLCAGEVLEEGLEGRAVKGAIDWARRFDHMQQHTGEHILGQSFFRLERQIAAVNMEGKICTVDLEGEVGWDLAMAAEQMANEAIWAAHPIRAYEIDESEVASVKLRRPPKVSGRIRIVQIGEFDFSACGGTHLRSSAEVGLLKILKLERVRSTETRVFFNCGGRVLPDYRYKHDFVAALALRLSSAPESVPERVSGLLDELTGAKREAAHLRTRLAEEIAAMAPERVVVRQIDDAALLPELAKAFAARPGAIALLGARQGERALLAVACGRGASAKAGDLLKVGLALVEGRGGGKPDLAQGSGTKVENLPAALEAMRAAAA